MASLIADPGADATGPARELFDRAKADFAANRLDSAEARFGRAATIDGGLALASLWHAQLLQWRTEGTSAADWTVPARRAMRNRDKLSERDAHHALALVALGEERFPDACREFGEVVRVDSQSFVGWFGLGECRRADRAVLRDGNAGSRWYFRSEPSAAIKAYTEALAWLPGEQVAPVLQRALVIFYSAPTRMRTGRALPPDTASFVAAPTVVGDTVAFVPYREREIPMTASVSDGRQRLRDMELAFVRRWVQLMPSNVRALAALSLSLESRGTISDDDDRTPDALSTIREARRRNSDPRMAARLQATEVRLLIKSSRFVAAGALADSALRAPAIADQAAGDLAALAVLHGREREAALHLQAMFSGTDGGRSQFGVPVPPAIGARLVHLVAAVETGRCSAAHLDSLERGVEELAVAMEKPTDRGALSSTFLDEIRVRAAVCTNGRSLVRLQNPGRPRAQLALAAARGDADSVLTLLALLDARRRGVSRSSLSWDAVAIEAWALAATGNLTQAAARLDSSLTGLSESSNRLTSEVVIAGGFRRTLQLRSDLAQKLGDAATSRRWRSALHELSRSGPAAGRADESM